MELTPTAEWLLAHGFKLSQGERATLLGCYYRSWPWMSYSRDDQSCLRIEPGVEGIGIVDSDRRVAILGGRWPGDRVAALWNVLTGTEL